MTSEKSNNEHFKRMIKISSVGMTQIEFVSNLPAGARFRWLVAPRSTIVQTSTVYTGFCVDAETALNRLLDLMVR
jgi:hypothetical protein